MESGSSSEGAGKTHRHGALPRIEPFFPKRDHNPQELKSWAKRTGFNPAFSGEVASILTERELDGNNHIAASAVAGGVDLEKGLLRPCGEQLLKKSEIEPILGRRKGRLGQRVIEITPAPEAAGNGAAGERERRRIAAEVEAEVKEAEKMPPPMEKRRVLNGNVHRSEADGTAQSMMIHEEPKKGALVADRETEIDFFSDSPEPDHPPVYKSPGLGITDNPGLGPLFFYSIQHYLSLAGSLVFIPLIMVPTMGGTDEETATVISTMLLVSGVTTILHSFFGTRLPLVQGSSFVYLAPALVIINSEEFRNLSQNKFRHIMRELQGAVIVGSLFQATLGYSGLMSLILRLINPLVVAPTVAAIGLAFFSYGFPQAGTCVEISIPLILLVLICVLYLRRLSFFGNHIFLIYAVPLSVVIIWAYAFFLTAGGTYNYKGCSSNIPSSNILLDACRKHATTMKYCRTDVSRALKTAAWFRVPYPFQWGPPTFSLKTSMIMVVVVLVASVDSVGSYHATSILVNLRPPTHGVVSRGIGSEGLASLLAGLWGTGTGSTTLTENAHTIYATKVASRKVVELGAALMILFSFVGKIGALIASIPLALAASVLCCTWALIVALGLSTLQYTQAASPRNIIIVGFTLFISFTVPAYFQQFEPNSRLILPSYLVPYAAASSGPIQTGSEEVDFALNALLSLNMVVAVFVAFVLDNTAPGNRQERGVYIWSDTSRPDMDPSSLEPYFLPDKVARCFRRVKWVGS